MVLPERVRYPLSRESRLRRVRGLLEDLRGLTETASSGRVFLRFGTWHASESSRNYATGAIEAGVSVYEATAKGEIFTISTTNLTHQGEDDLRYRLRKRPEDEPIFLVTGDEVGTGGDGEPLLRRVKIVRQLDPAHVRVSS